MKTAAKVFIIIGCIYGWILIFPLIIGIKACKLLDSAKTKDEVHSFGVVVLLFCSLIAGILMMCIKDEDLNPQNTASTVNLTGSVIVQNPYIDKDVGDILAQLKQLLDDGIISQEVYDAKRAKYLSML